MAEPGDVVGLRSRAPLRSRLIQLGGHPDDLLSEDPGEVGVPPSKKKRRRSREKKKEDRR